MTERSRTERRRRTLETLRDSMSRRQGAAAALALAEERETLEAAARIAARRAASETLDATVAAANLARSQDTFRQESAEARAARLAALRAVSAARRASNQPKIISGLSRDSQETLRQLRVEAEQQEMFRRIQEEAERRRGFGMAPIMRSSMNPRVIRNPMFGNIIAPTRQFRTFLPGAVGKVRSVGEIAPVRPIGGLVGTPFYKVPKNHAKRKLNAVSKHSKGMRKHASKLRKSVARKKVRRVSRKVRKVSRKRSKSVRRSRPLPPITRRH